MAAYSFRGTAFDVERAGIWEAEPPEPETVEERTKIPYGNVTIVDDAGDGLRVWVVPMIVAAADVAAMRANRRQVGALVTPRATWANCKLSQLRATGILMDGSAYRFEAEILVSA